MVPQGSQRSEWRKPGRLKAVENVKCAPLWGNPSQGDSAGLRRLAAKAAGNRRGQLVDLRTIGWTGGWLSSVLGSTSLWRASGSPGFRETTSLSYNLRRSINQGLKYLEGGPPLPLPDHRGSIRRSKEKDAAWFRTDGSEPPCHCGPALYPMELVPRVVHGFMA